jgi:hypothetical protein
MKNLDDMQWHFPGSFQLTAANDRRGYGRSSQPW